MIETPTTASSANREIPQEHAAFRRWQRQPGAQPGHERGEDHAEGEREDGEDQHRQPARADDVEVRVLSSKWVDNHPQRQQQPRTEDEAAGATHRKQTTQGEIEDSGDHSAEDAVEHHEADRAFDGDLAYDLFGLGDLPLRVVPGRHREQPHGEAASTADHTQTGSGPTEKHRARSTT